MGHVCRLCGQDIRDDERLRDRFAVSLDYHRHCIALTADALERIQTLTRQELVDVIALTARRFPAGSNFQTGCEAIADAVLLLLTEPSIPRDSDIKRETASPRQPLPRPGKDCDER